MPVLPFAAGITLFPGLSQRLVFIFFLGNGVGIGVPALRSQANQRILRDIVFLQILETVCEGLAEYAAEVLHCDAVLRTARPGKARLDSAEIKFEQVIKLRFWRRVGAEKALRLRVTFNQGNQG